MERFPLVRPFRPIDHVFAFPASWDVRPALEGGGPAKVRVFDVRCEEDGEVLVDAVYWGRVRGLIRIAV